MAFKLKVAVEVEVDFPFMARTKSGNDVLVTGYTAVYPRGYEAVSAVMVKPAKSESEYWEGRVRDGKMSMLSISIDLIDEVYESYTFETVKKTQC